MSRGRTMGSSTLGRLLAVLLAVGCLSTANAQWSALRHLNKLGKFGDEAASAARLSDDAAQALESVLRHAEDAPLTKVARESLGLTLEESVEAFIHSLDQADSSWKGGRYVALDDAGEVSVFRIGEGSSEAVYIEADAASHMIERNPITMDGLAREGKLRLAIPGEPARLRLQRSGEQTEYAVEVARDLFTPTPTLLDAVQARRSFNTRLKCEFAPRDTRVVAMFDPVGDAGTVGMIESATVNGAKFSKSPPDRAAIEAMLRDIDEDSIVIVGHIEDDLIVAENAAGERVFSFPLDRAREIVAERDRHLLVLGCGAGRAKGVSGPLANIDSAETARRLAAALRSESVGEFLEALASRDAPLMLHTVIGADGRLATSAVSMPVVRATAATAAAGGAATVMTTAVFIDSRERSFREYPAFWNSLGLLPAFVIGTAGTLGRRVVKRPLLLGWVLACALGVALGFVEGGAQGIALIMLIGVMAVPFWLIARGVQTLVWAARRTTGFIRRKSHA